MGDSWQVEKGNWEEKAVKQIGNEFNDVETFNNDKEILSLGCET